MTAARSSDGPVDPGVVPAQWRQVCSPHQLVDARARAVADALGEPGRIPAALCEPLVRAVEEYDLALARLRWARAWQSSGGVGQGDAIRWHTKQFHQALCALIGGLRRATEPAP